MTTRKKLRSAIDKAKNAVKHFHNNMTGVTTDGRLVFGLECIQYQEKNKTLMCKVNGNWRFENNGKGKCGWEKGRTTIHYYYDMPRK